jgi:WD40 repeat protein
MAGLVGTTVLPDLTPVAAEAGAAEGDPRPVYTWAGPPDRRLGAIRSYPPSGGGAPRLVVLVDSRVFHVWDTGTGSFLQALRIPDYPHLWCSLLTYQRASDGRPRVAAGSFQGKLYIWDGDDFEVLHTIHTTTQPRALSCLAVYEETTSGRTRLVTG